MMRLPHFRYHAPRSVSEAVDLFARSPDSTMVMGGGTDLLPNMKRRQQVPPTIIGLRNVAELCGMHEGDHGLDIGAGVTLAALVRDVRVRRSYPGLWQAALQIATPLLRNMGTIGGNLCLDTRCNYYDQNYEWRKSIDFCMKKDGTICWVAPSSRRCLAVSSADTVPALIALGASITLTSARGTRRMPLADLYRNDGIHYLTREAGEILTMLHLPRADGWRSSYWKLRRRGAFDFPVLGVAAAARFAADGSIDAARIVFGAVASSPLDMSAAATQLVGQRLTDDAIARAADAAAVGARPMDNTDFSLHWRKRLAREFAVYALRDLRGDDMRDVRRRMARLLLM
jgi:4-hydroxybenzoyl-CoA reductase subunit beta